jgi:hypothetical protein
MIVTGRLRPCAYRSWLPGDCWCARPVKNPVPAIRLVNLQLERLLPYRLVFIADKVVSTHYALSGPQVF